MNKRISTTKKIGDLLPKKLGDLLPIYGPPPANKSVPADTGKNIVQDQQLLKPPPTDETTVGNFGGKKSRCRFDMFVRLKKGVPFKFPGGKDHFTMRGDKYKDDPAQMLRHLLNTIKNRYHQYFLVELYDNAKPKEKGERVIVKLINGEPKINLLTDYLPLLTDYHLPEYLSVEMKH